MSIKRVWLITFHGSALYNKWKFELIQKKSAIKGIGAITENRLVLIRDKK